MKFPAFALSRHRIWLDGEGVNTLVTAFGCPLSCKYCINPQSRTEGTRIRDFSAEELLEEVRKDNLYFLATGGGVTFGGGEPLLFSEFISEFRAIAPAEWKIRIETSLQVPEENVRLAAAAADMLIVDIKDMNPEIYRRYAGGDAAAMKRNLLLARDLMGAERIRVRVPLIPEFNTPEDQEKSRAELAEMGFSLIELFPYRIKDFMTV